MKRVRLVVTAVLILAGWAQPQVPTCSGSGVAGTGLAVTGGRFGDPWSFAITGPPYSSALLASDLTPGPVATPFGPVCLGLTPALVTTAVTLDAAGNFAASGVLPLAAGFTAGSKLFVQAAILNPLWSGGAALTNGYAVSFRPPELVVLSPGDPSLALPGNFIALNGVSNAVIVSLVGPVGNAPAPFRVPRLGWIGWKTNAGPFRFVDDATGTVALEIPGVSIAPPYLGPIELTAISSDGAIFFTYGLGFPFIVRSYSLPSGALLAEASLTGSPWTMDPIPGTSLVYLRQFNRFDVLDGLTGAIVATVPLPGIVQFPRNVVHGQTVYCYTSSGLFAIDANTHAVVAGPVQPSLGFAGLLGIGPGTAGPALWAKGYYPQVGNALEEFPLTLSTSNYFLLPAAPTAAKPSAGGTEWLFEMAPPGQPNSLFAFHPPTASLTPIISSVTYDTLTVLRSGALSKVYVQLFSGSVVSFSTDPAASVGVAIPLPPTASQSLSLLSN